MIKPGKINEWVKEVEERPLMAPFIIRRIAERLLELDRMNETLRTENMNLESGAKTQEYEQKIKELEYQIRLLTHQAKSNGDVSIQKGLLNVFTSAGRILTIELDPFKLQSDQLITQIKGDIGVAPQDIHLCFTNEEEELLIIFDTGRVISMPASELRCHNAGEIDWQASRELPCRSGEKLTTILAVSEIPLLDVSIQISRMGKARSISKQYLQRFISNHNIGKGVRSKLDENFKLIPGNQQELFVVVSRSGAVSAQSFDNVPITPAEIIKLDMDDYLVAAFRLQENQHIVFASSEHQIFMQKTAWEHGSRKNYNKKKLISGRQGKLSLIGADSFQDGDWLFMLSADGQIKCRELNLKEKQKLKTSKPAAPLIAITCGKMMQPEGSENE